MRCFYTNDRSVALEEVLLRLAKSLAGPRIDSINHLILLDYDGKIFALSIISTCKNREPNCSDFLLAVSYIDPSRVPRIRTCFLRSDEVSNLPFAACKALGASDCGDCLISIKDFLYICKNFIFYENRLIIFNDSGYKDIKLEVLSKNSPYLVGLISSLIRKIHEKYSHYAPITIVAKLGCVIQYLINRVFGTVVAVPRMVIGEKVLVLKCRDFLKVLTFRKSSRHIVNLVG